MKTLQFKNDEQLYCWNALTVIKCRRFSMKAIITPFILVVSRQNAAAAIKNKASVVCVYVKQN